MGKEKEWPAILSILEGHDGWITSVTFSPNGQHIASSS
jgi:WD40 repeat protein